MGDAITPTEEQQRIMDSFAEQIVAPPAARKHLIINAAAGSGKTTTLRMMSQRHTSAQGLYIAFNRTVAQSASATFGSHVDCRTSHSLAYRFMQQGEFAPLLSKMEARSGAPQRDDRKALAHDFDMYSRNITVLERRKSGVQPKVVGGQTLVSIALQTLERFCQTAAREPSAAHVVSPRTFEPAEHDKYRQAVWEQISEMVYAMWADILDPRGKYMTFRHAHYLKLWQLSSPILPYDFVLLDEAQDTAPVVEDVVMRQAEHSLLVMVGDPSQAIYGFTGARDSMTRFERSGISHQSLTLSESWRFGQEIADAANALLAHTDRDMTIRGRGGEGEVLHHLSAAVNEMPGVYVCRSNFDVIEAALEAVAAGKSVDTSSVDLSDVEDFLDGALELKAGQRTKRGGLGAYATWAEFMADYDDGVPMTEGQRVGMLMLDKYDTEAACKVKIALIKAGASTSRKSDVKVTTIHKAKGGEWFDVSVRYDSAFRRVRDEDHPDQLWWELADPNLAYVAVTRAIDVLDPGRLWPVVEYGIVCDGPVLLSRAKGACRQFTDAEVAVLLAARTEADFAAFVSSRRRMFTDLAKALGVRDGAAAAIPMARLMHDVLVRERRDSDASSNDPAPAEQVVAA